MKILFFCFVVQILSRNVRLKGELYKDSEHITLLRDGTQLKALLRNADVAHLVEFYSVTCGHCLVLILTTISP